MGISKIFTKAGSLERAVRAASKKLEGLFTQAAGHAAPDRSGFLGEAMLGALAAPFFGAVMGPAVWGAVQTGMDVLQCLDEEGAWSGQAPQPVPAYTISRARARVEEYERRLARLGRADLPAPRPCAW